MRFHLDEHVSHAIAKGLRRRGIDVTTTVDAGLLSADDIDHIAFARAQRRVIYTNDPDFVALHRSGVQHAGMVFNESNQRSVGEVIDFLSLVDICMTEDDIQNRVEFF